MPLSVPRGTRGRARRLRTVAPREPGLEDNPAGARTDRAENLEGDLQ